MKRTPITSGVSTTQNGNAHEDENNDKGNESSTSDEEADSDEAVDFDPSAPETLHERLKILVDRVRRLKRELRESRAEADSLRGVIRENAAKELRKEKADVAIQCHVVAPEGHGWTEVTEGQTNGETSGLSISESIREAAQKVQRSQLMDELEQRGFVYEATSGFYYDPSSGYYYDAERQLYYDGNTKTYYSYNQETGSYTAFAAEDQQEQAEEDKRGGKRRRKNDEDRTKDPEVEKALKKEKEKLLDGIFNLRKCRDVEKRKKEEEEEDEKRRRKKKKKKRTEEEKLATKSKWDDDESDSDDDGKDKSETRDRKKKKKKKTPVKSEAEDGELSQSSSSSSSSSSSEDEENCNRRKKKKKKRHRSCEGKRSRDAKSGRRKEEKRVRDRSRDSRNHRDRGRDRSRDARNRSRDRDVWVEKKVEPLMRDYKRRRKSSSSSYSDDDDDWRRRHRRREEERKTLGYADAFGDDIDDDHLPPCIRVIVVSSECLDIGTYFVVTKDGAVIGSATDAAIRIEEEGVSAKQATVTYDMRERHYVITQTSDVTLDTQVNDEPLSSTATGATSVTLAGYVRALNHEDVVVVGSTRLLCHVHDGMDTCDDCEPGQIRARIEAINKEKELSTPSYASLQDRRRDEMKNLKRKFGLEKAAFEGPPPVPGEENYEDRAEQRRKKKGSSHPSHKKTTAQGASVKKALAATNKGHQLLSKMGWSEGKGLGKADQGIVEPIQVGVRSSSAGLGSETSVAKSMDDPEVSHKEMARIKAQQRFAKILAQEDADPP